MNINIQAQGFPLTEGLREHTRKRLQFALGSVSREVRQINVSLHDVNGPRGGKDKRCRIQIPITGGRDIVIEDMDADLYLAISRAAERAERSIVRRLERRRMHRRERLTGKRAIGVPGIEPIDDGFASSPSFH